MKIILVGGGKVGTALARQLSEEDHNVTIVDTNKARVEHLTESYDVLGIVGNGSSITTLAEAGIEDADVFIAVTGSDELNLLCCMFAKKAGHCHAIARVRNPSYSHELDFIKKQIGISAIINPEMAAAKEISHLLRFPGASKIDTFADGRVRLIKFALTAEQGLDGVAIREIPTRLKSDILVCAVERSGGVIIPNGNFVLQNGDQVTFLATQEKAHEFFQRIHLPVRPVRNAFIVGGGAIAFYLSQELLENHVRVRIVERDPARCMELAEQLPGAQILNEDGSNREFLLSEGMESTEAFVALTNIDEENVLAKLMVSIGTHHGRRVAAMITDMDTPLGHNIGNSLEVMESMDVLKGHGPADLTEVCLQLATNMLVLADKGTPAQCRAMAEAVIADGSAFAKCKEMFAAQGGDTRVLDDYSLFEQPAASFELLAEQDGYIVANDAEKIGSASVLLGAGRQKKGDPLDFAAGITLHKKRGDYVKKGESLATFYGAADKFEAAAAEYRSGLGYGPEKPEEAPLVYALVTKDGVARY